MADHNDPNSVNSIYSDIEQSAADLFDMFGFPGPDPDTVVLASTFAPVPEVGVLDTDMLYRILVHPRPRSPRWDGAPSLNDLLAYVEGVKDKYVGPFQAAEIRAYVDERQQGHISLTGFPGGDLTATVETNTVSYIPVGTGEQIKVWIGGRDDAFFNDLPGFFRSINYAPQYYHVPHDAPDLREMPIPKTLLELEGNTFFNYDPAIPDWGHGVKLDLPSEPMTWQGDRFAKDSDGNYRLVYSGKDAQAGMNVNAVVLELPLGYLTADPVGDRVVDVWAESWVRKASDKVETIPDDPLWLEQPLAFLGRVRLDEQLKQYKRVDTTAQPFADAALNEREDSRQVGAANFMLVPHFVKRLAHLGWGFGPSVSALGLPSSFDHGGSPVSVHRKYSSVLTAFPRVRKLIFQELRMPDDSWNPKGLDIPLRRPFEIFIPNVCAIDMDTTGTWPFGRRPEDQVATLFLSMFLDMEATVAGKPVHIGLLNDQAVWDSAPVVPKTPPNPLTNDREFLTEFPYLAEPW